MATVMARIERDAAQHSPGAEASAPGRQGRDRPAWLWTLVGAAVVLGVSAAGWIETGALPGVPLARTGFGRPLAMPGLGPASMILGAGLLLYLVGLLAPLRSGSGTKSEL
jgi:hypothetical protein